MCIIYLLIQITNAGILVLFIVVVFPYVAHGDGVGLGQHDLR